jgi:hypothetical protein
MVSAYSSSSMRRAVMPNRKGVREQAQLGVLDARVDRDL